MNVSLMVSCAAVACSLVVPFGREPVEARGIAEASCAAGPVLNAVGDALTTGHDSSVLAAALNGEKRLLACGNIHDAIAAELIAADAYGDVNKPVARCRVLRDAAKHSVGLGETARVRLIARAQASCALK